MASMLVLGLINPLQEPTHERLRHEKSSDDASKIVLKSRRLSVYDIMTNEFPSLLSISRMCSGLGETAPVDVRGNSLHCPYGEAISISQYPHGVLRRRRLGDSPFVFLRFMHLASVAVNLLSLFMAFMSLLSSRWTQGNGILPFGKMDRGFMNVRMINNDLTNKRTVGRSNEGTSQYHGYYCNPVTMNKRLWRLGPRKSPPQPFSCDFRIS
jgi:hypothetical protein